MTNASLRSQIATMEVGESISVPNGTYKANTIYNYASFIGRELGRTYQTRYNKAEGAVIVRRTA